MLLLLLLVAGVTNTLAQDVTIRGNNGSCVAAVKNGGKGDTFFRCGGFATWQHEQLSMVLTTSDGTTLTPNGQLDNPANNLFVSPEDADGKTKMRIAKGQFRGDDDNDPANVCYISISLPKGYRFTSYNIEFSRPADVKIGTTEPNYYGTSYDVYLNPTYAHTEENAGYSRTDAVRFGQTGNNFTYISSKYKDIAPGGANQTISANEKTDGQMGNVLYFKLEAAPNTATNIRSMIQLESARFFFTSEENFSPATPASEITTPVSAVKIPFPTSKVDFGNITSNNYQGIDRISYSSASVKDLEGNFMLYEAESTTTGTDIDNISGKIVDYKVGNQYTITSAGGYFKLGSGNANTEQVYFLEVPSSVEISNGKEVPVGYRITSAEIEYAKSVTASRTFYIRYRYENQNYYLGTNGRFSTNQTTWYMDGEGYIYTGAGTNKQYLVFNNGYAGVQTGKPASSERFGINSNNVIYQLNWPDYTVRWNRVRTGGSNFYPQYTNFGMISNTTGSNATYVQSTTSSASVGDFTLVVYDKTGKAEIEKTDDKGNVVYEQAKDENGDPVFDDNNNPVYVQQTDEDGNLVFEPAVDEKGNPIYVQDTNDDGTPKFDEDGNPVYVQELDEDGNPKVDEDGNPVYRQAQNPVYKPVMIPNPNIQTIPVNDSNSSGTVSLNNLNNDAIKFGVKGKGLVRATLTLQALDPYLKTMKVVCNDMAKPQIRIEDTFTASDFSVSGGEFYFYLPADCEKDDVQITFEDLQSEYFDDTYPGGSASHTSRLNFVKSEHYNAFNKGTENVIYENFDEAANAQLERRKVDIGGTTKFKFNNASEVDDEFEGSLEEYAFSLGKYKKEGGSFDVMEYKNVSADEQVLTRYIFTTDETRYNIAPTTAIQHRAYAFYEMIVHVSSGTYEPEVEFVPIYSKTLNGAGATDAYYGAVVTAYAGGKPGYSSTQEIIKILEQKIKDPNVTVKPADHSKLLYLDFSQLAGVYEITSPEYPSMEAYSATNAKNCLIFLPEGHGAPNNNVAAKISTGVFQAANSIVLTDMEPFYSPYQINVSSENKVEYTRKVTYDMYGKPKYASLILPFDLTIDEGVHTNSDGTTLSIHKLQETNAFTKKNGSDYAYAPVLADGKAEANKPYIIVIDGTAEGKDVFTISQDGGTIAPSISKNSDYTFDGVTSTGTETVTMKGSYAGQQIDKKKNIYYFANNEFVNSKDYKYTVINSAPFRAYFATPTVGAKLASFGLIFDEGIGDDPTGISSLSGNPDLMVIPGNGIITMTSTIEQNVRVNSVSGVLVNNAKLQAGETQTINVPAGVYVINGVKIIVK